MNSRVFSIVRLALFFPLLFGWTVTTGSPVEAAGLEEPKKNPASEPAAKEAAKPDPKPEKKDAPKDKKEAAGKEDKKSAEEGPKTHKVKAESFEVVVELDAVFEALDTTPISLVPEEWGDLTVVEAIPHGTAVKKGDVLIQLDTEALEEQVRDLSEKRPLTELGLKLAEENLEALELSTPLDLKSAERNKLRTDEDLTYFLEVGRKMREEDARQNVLQWENYLAYSKEELDQLLKMYEADDLTEETEEIIVKRARDDVAQAEWRLKETKERSDRELNSRIPRDHEDLVHRVTTVNNAWENAKDTLPDKLAQARLQLAEQKRANTKEAEKLEGLKADLAMLSAIKAPVDGFVYYGAQDRGKWATATAVERKLVAGGKLSPREVLMTIVQPAPVRVRLAVPEDKLEHLKEGLAAEVSPKSNPESFLEAKLESLSFAPQSDGKFDAIVTLNNAPESARLYPGMNASVRFDIYEKEKALTVPKGAVKREGTDHFVTLKGGEKKAVETGLSDGKVTEILSGLAEGDEIILE